MDFVVDGERVGSRSVPSYFLSPRYAQQNYPRDVLQIDVIGPLTIEGPGDTPSRRLILRCDPELDGITEHACVERILAPLARKAWRRPVTREELAPLLDLFASVAADEGFEHGIAAALQGLLVSPEFLFVIEEDPPGALAGSTRRLSDLEFATRLSLFLWSSIPDAELLALAEQEKLRAPEILDQQIKRMLADRRSAALTENFAGQWLYLRNLEHHRPDNLKFPEYDVRLRAAMRAETERFFSHILSGNRSVLEFLASDYTFANERLAEHYGIAGVSGPGVRRVELDPASGRGGLLGQASVLTVTSYGNHTSPVRRGKWILENILAAPPPPPPPDVPALVMAATDGSALSAREQMVRHREDPACASCHVKMDPLGLALEQYDPVGGFRLQHAGMVIDASATFPGGDTFTGLSGLRQLLLARGDQFTRALVQQLMIYALGRGIEAPDRPELRAIAASAAADGYRMHTIIRGIVSSFPFNHRTVSQP
jgi:hypothetical protein